MLQRIKDMRKPEPGPARFPYRLLYPGWTEIDPPVPLTRAYLHAERGLVVLHSIDLVTDVYWDIGGDVWWDHLSVSQPKRLPSWEELREVKNYFLGVNREAIQVLPREVDYVNLAENCLHIWARVRKED